MKETVTDTTGQRPGWLSDGRVDIDAYRAGTPDLADAPAIVESLCDEVEDLRALTGPQPCHRDGWGRTCHITVATYGTTAASLGDYHGRRGDAAIETYLGRCTMCGAVYAGVAPGGVYQDEPDFESRVRWVPVPGAVEAGE